MPGPILAAGRRNEHDTIAANRDGGICCRKANTAERFGNSAGFQRPIGATIRCVEDCAIISDDDAVARAKKRNRIEIVRNKGRRKIGSRLTAIRRPKYCSAISYNDGGRGIHKTETIQRGSDSADNPAPRLRAINGAVDCAVVANDQSRQWIGKNDRPEILCRTNLLARPRRSSVRCGQKRTTCTNGKTVNVVGEVNAVEPGVEVIDMSPYRPMGASIGRACNRTAVADGEYRVFVYERNRPERRPVRGCGLPGCVHLFRETENPRKDDKQSNDPLGAASHGSSLSISRVSGQGQAVIDHAIPVSTEY